MPADVDTQPSNGLRVAVEPDHQKRRRHPAKTESGGQKSPTGQSLIENTENGKHASQATILVGLALAQAKFFHGPDGIPYARARMGDHEEILRIRSNAMREWLSRLYWKEMHSVPGSQALQDAINLLVACALFDGPENSVHTRLGALDGNLYLDLTNPHWQVVEITPQGWQVVSSSPVAFRRSKTMDALPLPRQGGSLDALLPFVNLKRDEDRRLLVAFLLGCFLPKGPYPILALYGEHGTAKTTTSRLIKSILDPARPALRSVPRNEHDLMLTAQSNYLLVFDNASRIPWWFSDALCRLSTGGGFGTRQLYSDDDETTFDAIRPLILNGINELATRGDLQDRTITLELPVIPANRRKHENQFWQEFQAAHPLILGALLDVVSAILRELPTTHPPELPRMADFGAWVTAGESTLGWPAGTFLRDYQENHAQANGVVIDSSPVGMALLHFLQQFRAENHRENWSGTAAELMTVIEPHYPERSDDLPRTPQHLSGELRRLAPNLRQQGVFVTFDDRSGHQRERLIQIEFSTLPPADDDSRLCSNATQDESSPDRQEFDRESSSANLDVTADRDVFDL